MLDAGLRLAASFGTLGVEAAFDSLRTLADPRDLLTSVRIRRLLLTLQDSIQGRIPEILGDTEEEQVDTLVTLLEGTDDEQLDELMHVFQLALAYRADVREVDTRPRGHRRGARRRGARR